MAISMEDGAEKAQYPSDVSREQFEYVRPLLEGLRKRTKPRTVDLYEVFNAALYLALTGQGISTRVNVCRPAICMMQKLLCRSIWFPKRFLEGED